MESFDQLSPTWAVTLRDKYFRKCRHPLDHKITKSGTWIWNCIQKGLATIRPYCFWEVGSGQIINIWEDWWIPGYPSLPNSLSSPLTRVCELIDNSSNSWNLTLLHASFHPDIASAISKIKIRAGKIDSPKWHPSKTGEFSTKSLYSLIKPSSNSSNIPWNKVWNMRTSPSVRLFVYKCINNMLPLTSHPSRFTDVSNDCTFCGHTGETMEHLFFHCPFARSVWFASIANPFSLIPLIDSVKRWILDWQKNPVGWISATGMRYVLRSFVTYGKLDVTKPLGKSNLILETYTTGLGSIG